MSKDKGNKNTKKIGTNNSIGKKKEPSAYKSESKSNYAGVETSNPKLELKTSKKQSK
jgi:hypothetical protein